MYFSDYKGYSTDQLEKIFEVQTARDNLFENLQLSHKEYPETQKAVDEIKSRFALNEDANEATRSHLLITPVLLNACVVKNVGAFFEPPVNIEQEKTPNLPHQLSGKYDCALSLHAYKFVTPIISVVEVKPAQIGKGIGQCLAEMYATLKIFKQSKVYGIITDGVEWEFYLLENSVLTADKKGCYINNISGIIDRIGYIADKFKDSK
ncbi:MAG TPA: hypothetical protein ENG03_07330 [Thioploca sp.]|nr:MAG: hypothetical protein DRR19_10025 [Gammaproteobacteria bacterium]HDN26893.1 hypothetical protein [Thioploca sp.]